MQLTDSEKLCEQMLDASPKQRSRHHLRSALNHIRRAETLLEIDRPMTMFRSLTAIEEAASGIILCLREKGYDRSEKLKWKNHLHKNAFIPFFKVLGDSVEKHLLKNGVDIDITVREIDGKKMQLVEMTFKTEDGPLSLIPLPPLNSKIEVQGSVISFDEEMKGYAEKVGTDSVLNHVKRLMNWRNEVLYAGTKGYVSDVDSNQTANLLTEAKRWVFVQMRLYLMIQPYPPQAFVQHALDALLEMLNTPKLVAAFEEPEA